MTDTKVWYSLFKNNYLLGNKLGISAKYRGHDWEPATHVRPLLPDDVKENLFGFPFTAKSYSFGHNKDPKHFPEAAYVFDDKRFKRVIDLLWVNACIAFKGELAAIMKQAEMGRGGLVPVPLYEADRTTPRDENLHILNFDGPKDALVIEQSEGLRFTPPHVPEERKFYSVEHGINPKITLNTNVLEGAEIWQMKQDKDLVYFSDRLVQAVLKTKNKKVIAAFDFQPCTIVEV
jgi:hypothetical protein